MPALAVDELTALRATHDPAARRALLDAFVARPDVDEALMLASPTVHASLASWRSSPDSAAARAIERTILKYVMRMAYRATPFGRFAGVTSCEVGESTQLAMATRAVDAPHTRLDCDSIGEIAAALVRRAPLRAALGFRVNSSLYRAGAHLSYARLDLARRQYVTTALDVSEPLELLLARAHTGATLPALATVLEASFEGVSPADAASYIDDLVDAQVLVPEIGVAITGGEPLAVLADHLRSLGAVAAAETVALDEAQAGLRAVDAGDPAARVPALRAIVAQLAARLDLPPAQVRVRVDLHTPAVTATVGRRVVDELQRAVTALARVAPNERSTALTRFRARFLARYETREVALVEALDEDLGIGFESPARVDDAPLLHGLSFLPPSPVRQVPWGARERWLLARLHQTLARGEDEIALTDDELARLPIEGRPLPPSYYACVRLATRPDGRDEILLASDVRGPASVANFGRFAYLTPSIDADVRAQIAREDQAYPDALYAEIVHLPEGRSGNVMGRPVLRGWEIAILGQSGAPASRQLALDDLTLRLRGGRLVLRSRRLGRDVIPRMTTAHNHTHAALPAYRLLCALAEQGASPLFWDWGALVDAPYLPRVRVGQVVLARARWRLSVAELAPLRAAARTALRAETWPSPDVLALARRVREQRNLPRWVAMVHGDNELPIDLDDRYDVDLLAAEASERDLLLVERFASDAEHVARGPQGRYAAEVGLAFTTAAPTAPRSVALPPRGPAAPIVGARYAPGSRWLYAKLYGRPSTADALIVELAAAARGLVSDGTVSHWFFLRFADPEPHIRIRLHGDPEALRTRALPVLEALWTAASDAGTIIRVAIDTYEPEVARYGGAEALPWAEQLFWFDSDMVARIIASPTLATGDARWQLALAGADRILADLELPEERRAAIVIGFRDGLAAELGGGPPVIGQIGQRYRREASRLEALVGPRALAPADPLAAGLALLDERSVRGAEAVAALQLLARRGQLARPLEELAASLIHMHVNRMIATAPRAQELVIYDLLRRVYATRRARGA